MQDIKITTIQSDLASCKKLCMEITSGCKGNREYGLCCWGEQDWDAFNIDTE